MNQDDETRRRLIGIWTNEKSFREVWLSQNLKFYIKEYKDKNMKYLKEEKSDEGTWDVKDDIIIMTNDKGKKSSLKFTFIEDNMLELITDSYLNIGRKYTRNENRFIC